jgi:hypothetical protein
MPKLVSFYYSGTFPDELPDEQAIAELNRLIDSGACDPIIEIDHADDVDKAIHQAEAAGFLGVVDTEKWIKRIKHRIDEPSLGFL